MKKKSFENEIKNCFEKANEVKKKVFNQQKSCKS